MIIVFYLENKCCDDQSFAVPTKYLIKHGNAGFVTVFIMSQGI
jgi:hypothetical protein